MKISKQEPLDADPYLKERDYFRKNSYFIIGFASFIFNDNDKKIYLSSMISNKFCE